MAQTVIELKEGHDAKHRIGQKASYWKDSASQVAIEQIITPEFANYFQASTKPILFFGIDHAAYWVKMKVRNANKSINDWVLIIDFPILDSIEIYHQNSSGVISKQEMGFCLPFDKKPLDHNAFAIPLKLDDEEIHTFYIRVKSRKTKYVPLSIVRDRVFQEERGFRDMGYGFFFGIFFIMLAYNLAIYFSLRERSYLFYSLVTLIILCTYTTNSGYAPHYFWPNSPWINQYILIWLSCASSITGALFTQSFLHTRKHLNTYHHILTGFAIVSTIAMFTTIPYTFTTGKNMYLVLLLQIVLMITVGIKLWHKGYREAMFYVIAWSGYTLGAVVLMARNLGVFPTVPLVNHAGEIGAVWQVIMLALALSDRYGRLRKEKEQAIQERLETEENAKRMLEYRVEERTAELMETNEELNLTVEELHMTNERLSETNSLVSKKNRNITASINYAQRIQYALLPSKERITAIFPENFVFFKPRDIVSGDFYWFDQTDKKAIMVVADCTGHGVPGAFMALLGGDSISHAVVRMGLDSPAEILQYTDAEIHHKLRQYSSNNQDGMDAGVVVYEAQKNEVTFSGAKRPMLVIKGGKAELIKGDKYSIGGKNPKKSEKIFTNKPIIIDEPTDIYVFSDGYPDQFGGSIGGKFTTKRFYQLLEKNHHLPMQEQQRLISENLENWIGRTRQIDDILVIGLRLYPTK